MSKASVIQKNSISDTLMMSPYSFIYPVLIFLYIATCPVLALDPSKSVFQFNCQNWNRQSGLPSDKVNSVAQSTDGYIWLGTQNGLVRFDGLEFKTIPITMAVARGQDVRSVVKASKGGVWFCIYNGGVGRYDDHLFFPLGDERMRNPGFAANTLMESKEGDLWIGFSGGWGKESHESSSKNSFAEMGENIIAFGEDLTGGAWMGTPEHGLIHVSNGVSTRIEDPFLKQQNIFALAMEGDGRLWVGMGSGLRLYEKGQLQDSTPIANQINAILVDSHGVLWIGTFGMGLARYEKGIFSYLRKTDGLGSDYVTSLCEDAEGSLWIGTVGGLSQLRDLKFPILSNKEDLLKGSVHAVAASAKGGLWVSTDTGVSYVNGATITSYTQQSLLPNQYVKRIMEARNGEVYAIDGSKNVNVFSGDKLVSRYVNEEWPTALAEDSESVLIGIGTKDCLYRLKNGEKQSYPFEGGTQPPFYWINDLFVSKDGAIWVSSSNGIFLIKKGKFSQWSTGNGLSGDLVHSLAEDSEGVIWAALATGMARIKNGKVTNIKQENGLPDPRIYAVVTDDRGNFWGTSGRGLFRVTLRSLEDFCEGRSVKVDCELFDGLESAKFIDRTDQESTGCRTSDGRIWFPTPWGVVEINPYKLTINTNVPQVHIDRMLANKSEFKKSEIVVVPPGKGELEFYFDGLSFVAPKKIKFRYRLEGYEKDWVEVEGRRNAFYTNLKPGLYTFRVLAANADGIWNNAGDSVRIRLNPHFYQTWWFDFIIGILVCGIVAGIYILREKHLRSRQLFLQQSRDQLETEVANRTEELALANKTLKTEVTERIRTAGELAERSKALEAEIEERKKMQSKLEGVHKQLLEISRQAGMAEVASNVLHNVGNVLNSVNVSACLLRDSIKKSKVPSLAKAVSLIREHEQDLGTFLSSDPKGKQLGPFLMQLSEHMEADQLEAVNELEQLRSNIEHIKEIVTMQQNYARVSAIKEEVDLSELFEDSLRLNLQSLKQSKIEVAREYEPMAPQMMEKHKLLQILVNLVRNAEHSCQEAGKVKKQMTLSVKTFGDKVRVAVKDDGVGIPEENLTRIFSHGFTTKKGGHGFGLHSSALAARELGGSLTVHSEGPGKGATFTLELPLIKEEVQHA
ncbi:MAG: sensor signal transduction histidine kinase [Verrucomicrobiales bacterium]|nr:sensor signal transduction histidine kinase [Verrucomicrobiales bacterium]